VALFSSPQKPQEFPVASGTGILDAKIEAECDGWCQWPQVDPLVADDQTNPAEVPTTIQSTDNDVVRGVPSLPISLTLVSKVPFSGLRTSGAPGKWHQSGVIQSVQQVALRRSNPRWMA
jgi:hypothetical protein